MGHYNMVKPGDPFRPSAKLENEVRRFFNGGATISGGKSKAANMNNFRISAVNNMGQNINAGLAVAIHHNDENDFFYFVLAESQEDFLGITAETIAPHSSGTVIVSGIARAFIAAGRSGEFAIPGPDGKLSASSSGRAQILYVGTTDEPGMVLLGAGGGGEKAYEGQFAIRNTGERTFEVRWPQNDIAGYTDLPGVAEVPVQTLTLPENVNRGDIKFYACCNEDVYSAVIQWDSQAQPQGAFDSFYIGYVTASGYIEQWYRDFDNYGMVFGRRWFL